MAIFNRRFLTPDRALPCDILHYAGKIPIARAEMSVDLSLVAAERSRAVPRVSWTALFVKAYGMVSDQCEWLRASYMSWPVRHVYQHSRSVARVTIQREIEGRPRLCWGRFIGPGQMSLHDIQAQLDRYQQGPPEEMFRKQLGLSRVPWPLRRVVWWGVLNLSGRGRERQLGTFSLSSLAGQGVINRDHPTVCTSSITYGPVEPDGACLITLVYDHRLFDGMQAARALQQLRDHLQQEIVAELAQHSRRSAA